jgi:5-hydroxyisourate hydrolase
VSAITTHVLDTSIGRPAAGVAVSFEALEPGKGWTPLASALTDADGRVREFVPPVSRLERRRYRLVFDSAAYFAARDTDAFYPVVVVVFEVDDSTQHYHVPLLLSPFGYSTYRGS